MSEQEHDRAQCLLVRRSAHLPLPHQLIQKRSHLLPRKLSRMPSREIHEPLHPSPIRRPGPLAVVACRQLSLHLLPKRRIAIRRSTRISTHCWNGSAPTCVSCVLFSDGPPTHEPPQNTATHCSTNKLAPSAATS